MSSDGNSLKNDIAIKLEGVCKYFQIYEKPHHRLMQGLFRGKKQFYKEFKALEDISLEIKKGETVGIIGRNGAGKSTLLQIICGTMSPTFGTVNINGRIAALLELGSGFNPEFTGRENVFMNGAILGLTKAEIEDRFDKIAAFAEIGDFIDQPVKTYSSGMYVRLAFAVIAHVDADILIIDEALSVGDAFFTQKCMRFLRTFMKHGTLLFVSHDNSAITNLCERAVWLDTGKVRIAADAKTVCEKYFEGLYAAQQNVQNNPSLSSMNTEMKLKKDSSQEFVDGRLAFINSTQYRNDIKLFQFDPDAESFGAGGVEITDISLCNESGEKLSWVVGGEVASLLVTAKAKENLGSLIVGFFVKDRLGQTIFGDNTYFTKALSVTTDDQFFTKFIFRFPLLPVGDYSISVAMADGTHTDHIQHVWIHDAIIFKSEASSIVHGLLGIPMLDIQLNNINKK
ncbi:ABC transporter ATP-binding protein [Gimesia aquarii]|uniref:Teichoic acids export ATP-binding protein TagH n=1 Tax=Gimesia aquarii TaxID=2527964 RepID=A0A517X0D1_9PLAN|nr:ABC transporter ATP-binding protein [Gimesia aquarii]QDU10965.1 Teichoic acids export ATP-binding protein TagH [Gimesia aquarii]